MKKLLFVLTLGAALAASPAFAQPTDAPATPPGEGGASPAPGAGGPGGPGAHHDHMKFLTDAEKAELKKAHDAALAADPTLATDEKANMDAMKAAHEAGTTDDQKAQMHAFREKMDAAMLKADPDVAPVLAKIKAHHPHGGPGGPGGDGPPPAPAAQ
jgi:hypothetical protein